MNPPLLEKAENKTTIKNAIFNTYLNVAGINLTPIILPIAKKIRAIKNVFSIDR